MNWNQILEQVITICVEECGARGENFLLYGFAHHFAEHLRDHPTGYFEWRFQGDLGYGGKLKYQSHDGFHVDCYREDETPERLERIEKANKRLEEVGEIHS